MQYPGFRSPYSPNTDADRRKMLEAIGVTSVEELFQDIPPQQRSPALGIPDPTSELDLRREIEAMAGENLAPGDYACFLGAGAYRHHIPAVVRQIASRGEYATSYTPYQAEVAQGTLQTTYEFQTLVCQLTGMEVANAGMYEGASSLAEAALMAARITGRERIAVLDSVSPSYVEVLQTFVQGPGLILDSVSSARGPLNGETACLIVQQPNFFGYLEELAELSERAHSHGALLVVHSDPIALAMLKPPGDYDADIVVAEGQSVGVAPSYGGPYVGFFACKERHLRQMPGRIAGRTVDTKGRTGYVLTLQTREQHIRRERATSNICTSVALVALMTTAYMAALGRRGMRHIAEMCYHKAHYAASLIEQIPGYSLPMHGMFFREFVVSCPLPPAEVNRQLLKRGIIGGLDVSSAVPNGMLLWATEMNPRGEIEALATALAEIGKGA
jgi:glycine dehydrogenase subunit 1